MVCIQDSVCLWSCAFLTHKQMLGIYILQVKISSGISITAEDLQLPVLAMLDGIKATLGQSLHLL